ncbi:MAG: ATP phosphoribosyltransferase [Aquificaceae bacterium]|jgi:ATP phosphoribosyltransferase|uniref:ATP phosphoribosyltransferase n=1 Tax=Hydrogenobacter sp. Uz 6-8 TaxID=3384828 RepID=UPI0030952A8B
MLRIALPKGRLFEESLELFLKRGIIDRGFEEGRRLSVRVGGYEFLLVKPSDVPVYVENGVADLGVVGRDVLLEKKPDLYVLLDLGIGFCKIVVAGKEEGRERYLKSSYLKVATKYPRITQEFFSEKGVRCKVIPLSGSVELAPIMGLSDFIVDLVQTGRTLKENNLVVVEEITTSTAMLVCNRASYRNMREEVMEILEKLL